VQLKGRHEVSSKSIWLEAEWLDEAVGWIDRRLKDMGEKRMGPIEQPHVTGSTTVLRASTSMDDVYFKAVSPPFRFEIELTRYLARNWPETSPRVLAADPDQGWMLMADGGERLRELLKAGLDLSHWESVLSSYARLQRETIEHSRDLLSLGTPDRRLPLLIEHFDRFLEHPERLISSELTEAEVNELIASRPTIPQYCGELSSLGINAALDHGDFHDGNIFAKQGAYIFFDWGDAGLTHPFFSLRTAFVSLENSLGFEEEDPVFGRLSEHYLQSWLDWGSKEVLQRAYQVSRPLASINAAVRWQFIIDNLDKDLQKDYKLHVPSLLHEVVTGLRRI
jgi:hypothetical protein